MWGNAMAAHNLTAMTTNNFAAQKIVNPGFECRSYLIDFAAGLSLLENIFADHGRDGVFKANKIIGTSFLMHVATAFFARRFVKGISTAIAFVSDDIINTVLAKRLTVACSEALFWSL